MDPVAESIDQVVAFVALHTSAVGIGSLAELVHCPAHTILHGIAGIASQALSGFLVILLALIRDGHTTTLIQIEPVGASDASLLIVPKTVHILAGIVVVYYGDWLLLHCGF